MPQLMAGLDLGRKDLVQPPEFVAGWRDWLRSRCNNR